MLLCILAVNIDVLCWITHKIGKLLTAGDFRSGGDSEESITKAVFCK